MRRMLMATTSLMILFASCADRATQDDIDLDPPDGEDTVMPAAGADSVERFDSVSVFFTRDEQPIEVRRRVTDRAPGLRAALELLLAGPDAAEQAEGLDSFFSAATAGMLRSLEVDGSHAVVDFADLRPVIPNASSSTGSTLLLQELNATVFQFPEIHTIEYLIDGSCAAFWEWLQYECRTVTRPGL